jgi:hypothetical protein
LEMIVWILQRRKKCKPEHSFATLLKLTLVDFAIPIMSLQMVCVSSSHAVLRGLKFSIPT